MWLRRTALLALSGLALIWGSEAAAAPSADVTAKRREVRALNRQLAAFDVQAGIAAAAHNRALDRLDGIRSRSRATRTDILRTRSDLSRSRELLARRLVAIYVQGTPGPLEVLLQAGSITDVVTITDVLDATARSDARIIAAVRERAARLASLQRRLAADARATEAEVTTVQTRERQVEALIAGRRQALDGAQAQLGRLLAAERARLIRLAAEKRARQAAESTSAYSAGAAGAAASPTIPGGSHVFPLAGPSRFSDDWLASRPGGRYHEGIDLFAARGTPVVAVADGTLYRVGYSGISGNRLWLRDDAGTAFFYAHLDAYAPATREGASVTRGTVLGYNGDTGDAKGTSPHVHFEIHPGGGGPVRPYPIVSAWPRAG
jgi:murein DD-endopeptidase MepM/ murein hydrolase activator NlpD